MELTEVTQFVDTADGSMGIAIKYPASSEPHPALLLFHHGPGLDGATHAAMRILAEGGFYVIAFDRYHRLGPFHHFAFHRADGTLDEQAMAEARVALLTTTDEQVADDVRKILLIIRADEHAADAEVAGLGYCVGARSLLLAMVEHAQQLRTGVALHPSFCVLDEPPARDAVGILATSSPHRKVAEFAPGQRLLIFLGAEDQMASVELNRPLVEAVANLPGKNGHVEVVPGADHGFGLPGHAWAGEASTQAYRDALEFLRSS